ncbi:hypothetical protein ABXV03_18120 [Streptomyces harbinensis]|uniref:hypothetical protein n=1 Tax=Streptomyces harbinensis TaxID=1176198 RepID=UPI0033982731
MNHTHRAARVRRLTGLLAGAVLLLTGAGLNGPAVAAPAPAPVSGADRVATEAAHTVDLVSTAEELLAPTHTRPGLTTFHATTTQPGTGWIGLARLRDGKDWDDFLDTLLRALSNDPSEVPGGAQDLEETATLLGGLVIHPGQPGSFTQRLKPGTYLLFDYLTVAGAEPRHRTLTVTGSPVDRGLAPTATVVSRDIPGVGPRFELRGTLLAGRPVRFINLIPGQVNELLFVRIAEDTTQEDLRDFFATMPEDGSFPPESPFLSLSLGSLHLSTHQSSVVQLPLEQGRYAALTWAKDADDGVLLVNKGLFTIVDVG